MFEGSANVYMDGNFRAGTSDSGGNSFVPYGLVHGSTAEIMQKISVDELKRLVYDGDVERELLALLKSYGIPEEYVETRRQSEGARQTRAQKEGLA